MVMMDIAGKISATARRLTPPNLHTPSCFKADIRHEQSDTPSYIYCLVQRAQDVIIGDKVGSSDCFVKVYVEGHKDRAKRTRVIPKSLNPVWDTTLCVSLPRRGGRSGRLVLELFDDDFNGKDLLGFASIDIASLVGAEVQGLELALKWKEGINLKYNQQRSASRGLGRLFVRIGTGNSKVPPAEFVEAGKLLSAASLTKVPAGFLETRVRRLGVSGGTAPFFALKLAPEHQTPGLPEDFFIGKDLSRAEGEAEVYEEMTMALKAAEQGNDPDGLGDLLGFTMQYRGILMAQEDLPEGSPQENKPPLDILVLQNLRCGRKNLRLLDIKVGEKTACANWQGKSAQAAKRQSFVDSLTTSSVEGFRLEGFDGAPESLTSMNPVLDIQQGPFKSLVSEGKIDKKARRFQMQRLSAADIAAHYLRLQGPGSVQVQEVVLHETMTKAIRLAIACRKVKVPQKWVGSSIALGFDAAAEWTGDEAAIRSQVIVQIFDWGRSELNTGAKYQVMSKFEQSDRIQFWRYYCRGLHKLAFELMRFYHHMFNNPDPYPRLEVSVWDFDSLKANDLIGSAELKLVSSSEPVTVELHRKGRRKRCGTLTYCIEWVDAPAGSRLAGWWCVTFKGASGLLALDSNGTSDPLVTLTSTSGDGAFKMTWQTRVIERELNPVWDESFEIPVAHPGARPCIEALESACGSAEAVNIPTPEKLAGMLPVPSMLASMVGHKEDVKLSMDALEAWNRMLDGIQSPEVFAHDFFCSPMDAACSSA